MKPAFDPIPRALEIVCPVCGASRDNWCRGKAKHLASGLKYGKRKTLHKRRLDRVR